MFLQHRRPRALPTPAARSALWNSRSLIWPKKGAADRSDQAGLLKSEVLGSL